MARESTTAKIAALQMTSGADVGANLSVAARLLAEASAAGAQRGGAAGELLVHGRA